MQQIITDFVLQQLNLLTLEHNNHATEFINNTTPSSVDKLEFIDRTLKLVITNIVCKAPKQCQIDLEPVGDLSLNCGLSKGDLVICIRSKGKGENISGVVVAVDENTLSIITNSQYENIQEKEVCIVTRTDSDLTFKRQKRALELLNGKELYSSCSLQIVHILFDTDKSLVRDLSTAKDPIIKNCLNEEGDLKFINENLVKEQKSAVEFALKQRYFAVIEGPPGTGKTSTLIEIILQLHRMGKKILVCAQTNVAVDNLVVRLGETQLKPLRLGNLSRISAEAVKYSLNSYLEGDDGYEVLKDISKSIEEMELDMLYNNSRHLFKEIKSLRKEYKKRYTRHICDTLRKHSVLLCTLNSASSDSQLQYVPSNYFDVLIVDEASQAMEASMWIAIPNASKLILAGDIHQLPPVVMCKQAIDLNISLMERAMKKLDDDCFITLRRQFRMNEKIMAWSNKKFYNNILEADISVKNHLLKDLTHVKKDDCFTNEAVVYIDTCGCECEEYNTGKEFQSKGNLGEAVIVEKIVTALVEAGLTHEEIGVITPYALQVDFIHKSFAAKSLDVEVSTVDGFQGREKEVIVFSLVRSNQNHELGFVTDCRRLNVAVTRARRLLIVIGDSETMEKDKLISSLLKHLEENGLLQTAAEYSANTINNEIDRIKRISQCNLRRKVKPKVNVQSSKQEKSKKPAVKDEKKLDEKVREVVPKFRNTGSANNSNLNANRNKYNVFVTNDTAELDEEGAMASKSDENENKSPAPSVPHNSNKKERPKKKQDDAESKSNEDKQRDEFDKIIDEFKKSNSTCSFNGCKKSTNLIKLICEFCKKWFCLEHGMQEIHGCGDAIRRKEQKAFKHRKLKTTTKLDKNKFAQKLKKLEDARKPNKKNVK